MKTKNIKIERKVTVEMARHGWKIAPDGKVYVGSRMMTVSAAREMVRQNKAAQAYAATLPIPLPSWLVLGPQIVTPDPTPGWFTANWEAASKPQLEWLAVNGGYMQKIIAGRYLRDWAKDHPGV